MSLELENTIQELEKKIQKLRDTDLVRDDVQKLETQLQTIANKMYENMTDWHKVLVARHKNRPKLKDYLSLFDNLFELCGDRRFRNDNAMYTGIGLFKNRSVAVIGHNKGITLDENIKNNFGMSNPSGYYKAIRLFKLANKLQLPVISFVDTPGGAAGLEAEEQGQYISIAECIATSLEVTCPIMSIIIGEGGSGGAVAIASADKVLMLENSVYSIISPEGCSSILWKNTTHKENAAAALKLNAEYLLKCGVVDRIIKEPVGGAHHNKEQTIKNVEKAIEEELKTIKHTHNKRFI